jgi:hypothetical protein
MFGEVWRLDARHAERRRRGQFSRGLPLVIFASKIDVSLSALIGDIIPILPINGRRDEHFKDFQSL